MAKKVSTGRRPISRRPTTGDQMRNRTRRQSLLFALVVTLIVSTGLPGAAQPEVAVQPYLGFQGEDGGTPDLDNRVGMVAPTSGQEALARRLGGSVRWNEFGTPHVLMNHRGVLSGPRDGDHVEIARGWVRDHRELFRLTTAGVDALEVLRVSPLFDSPDQVRDARGQALANPDVATVVLFRQTFGELSAAQDGLLHVGVTAEGAVAWISSSVTGDSAVTPVAAPIDAKTAYRIAAGDVGRRVDEADLSLVEQDGAAGFDVYRLEGSNDLQYIRQVAMPTPTNGVRLAWETVVLQARPSATSEPMGFSHFVDAETGQVLFRSNALQHLATQGATPLAQTAADDEPVASRWRTFPANPTLVAPPTADQLVREGVSEDTRQLWCWTPRFDENGVDTCDRVVGTNDFDFFNGASRAPWDIDISTGRTTNTTEGNNADTAPSFFSPLTPDNPVPAAVSPEQNYDFPWTNQWYESSCNPQSFVSPQRNDIDAATTALFVGHNRIHDWAYYLGWTERNSNMQRTNFGLTDPRRENDPETGQSQAGSLTGTVTPIQGRDNANQITLNDGIPGITNQYLWQPIASAFYPACVDGAYDQAVIGHEVGHAVQNRMTAGPDAQLSGDQSRAMGESWSDLTAIEYLNGFGFVPTDDENVFSVGAYVAGDPIRGIRNYAMNDSPLNYSDIGYDFLCVTFTEDPSGRCQRFSQVHADGEIWSATHFAIREALIQKYDQEFPASDRALQVRCADGDLPAQECAGNRRWIQMIHDGFLMQPSRTSMVDSRDAILAADILRFDGANQKELWDVFAEHGLGEGAFSDPARASNNSANDDDPIPSFSSPLSDNASVTFATQGVEGGPGPEIATVFVGEYEARVTPIADTDPGTETADIAQFVPGVPHTFLVRADGFGAYRFTRTFAPGEDVVLQIPMQPNLSSIHAGAEVTGGDGINRNSLIDDTEGTNWFSGSSEGTASLPRSVEGRQVTVKLVGDGAQEVGRVQVSAQLRPRDVDNVADDPEEEPGEDLGVGDTVSQNRFSALRSFQILACNAEAGDDCATDEGFEVIHTSAEDAFPSVPPRPRSSDLTLRSFDVSPTEATHIRLRALTNQCTGVVQFQGKLDRDPDNETDCIASSGAKIIAPQGEVLRAAELQVFDGPAPVMAAPANPDPGTPESPGTPENPGTPNTPPSLEVRRVAGSGRIETAIQLSQAGFDAADSVVLARADQFPDALASATLAAEIDGPVLLGGVDALDSQNADELRRLDASTVYLAGGVDAQSEAVEQALVDAGYRVERLAGLDRFETAALIASEVVEIGGPVESAIIARAEQFPDALAAGNLAAAARAPILLAAPDAVPATTRDALAELLEDGDTVTLAGGTAALDEGVEATLTGDGYAVDRKAGAERYETAALLVTEAIAQGATPNPTVLASGADFPDALAAVSVSHALGGVTVLVDPNDLSGSAASAQLLEANADAVRTLLVAGGPNAIAQQVVDQVTALLTGA